MGRHIGKIFTPSYENPELRYMVASCRLNERFLHILEQLPPRARSATALAPALLPMGTQGLISATSVAYGDQLILSVYWVILA